MGLSLSPSMDKTFLLSMLSRLVLGPTQPPTQCIPGALSLGVKWLGCEADHSPQTSAKIKNMWFYTSLLHAFSYMVLNQLSTGITIFLYLYHRHISMHFLQTTFHSFKLMFPKIFHQKLFWDSILIELHINQHIHKTQNEGY
jgi:hypothetical protein